jgi:hypothetical protein
MYVKLKGTTGYHDGDDKAGSDNEQDHILLPVEQEELGGSTAGGGLCPDEMPEDHFFSGMVAIFLWGFIVEDNTYKSKQVQLSDSGRHKKGLNTKKQAHQERGHKCDK